MKSSNLYEISYSYSEKDGTGVVRKEYTTIYVASNDVEGAVVKIKQLSLEKKHELNTISNCTLVHRIDLF